MRYTSKGSSVYATFFGWPDGETVLLESFAKGTLNGDLEVKNIALLGYEGDISWEATDKGLKISLPSDVINEMAIVFKLDTEGTGTLAKN